MTPLRATLACLRCTHFRADDNPINSPFSKLLIASALEPCVLPVWAFASTDRWIQARVIMDGLQIDYRHPDPDLLLISNIASIAPRTLSLHSSLRGLIRFFFHATHPASGLSAVISSMHDDHWNKEYPAEHASLFYEQMVGFVETISLHDRIWYVGDPHDPRRNLKSRFWKGMNHDTLPQDHHS